MRLPNSFAWLRQRSYAANIPKFFVFRFLWEFMLFLPIWVIFLQEVRGFSLTQVTLLDAAFWLIVVVGEVPTGADGAATGAAAGSADFATAGFGAASISAGCGSRYTRPPFVSAATATSRVPNAPDSPYFLISASVINWSHARQVKDAPRPCFGAAGATPDVLPLTTRRLISFPMCEGSIHAMAPFCLDSHHDVERMVVAPQVGLGHGAVRAHIHAMGVSPEEDGKCCETRPHTRSRTTSVTASS